MNDVEDELSELKVFEWKKTSKIQIIKQNSKWFKWNWANILGRT